MEEEAGGGGRDFWQTEPPPSWWWWCCESMSIAAVGAIGRKTRERERERERSVLLCFLNGQTHEESVGVFVYG